MGMEPFAAACCWGRGVVLAEYGAAAAQVAAGGAHVRQRRGATPRTNGNVAGVRTHRTSTGQSTERVRLAV